MSQSSPETMTREELESEVDTLRDQVGGMQADIAFLKRSLAVLTDADLSESEHHPLEGLPDAAEETRTDIEDVQTAVSAHGEQLDALADVGGKKTSKDEKVAAIATFALQKAGKQSKVLVTADEIKGCLGCSRRYPYTLIDDLDESDEHEWAGKRKATSVSTATGTQKKKKALKVDCDALRESSHGPDGVNQFTTRSHEGGA